MNAKIRAALAAAKKSAKRELGMFAFMLIFGLCVVVVAVPIIFITSLLPDWTWWIWLGCGAIWMIFGETISAGFRAYRGDRS
jgi:hypothetical protein